MCLKVELLKAEKGDTIKIDNFEYKIVDKDGQRIDKILVTKI